METVTSEVGARVTSTKRQIGTAFLIATPIGDVNGHIVGRPGCAYAKNVVQQTP
jgi:hypothetical protein